jgi:hypothetical protein
MGTRSKLCTFQRFCQASSEGKAILLQTWYCHAAQRALKEEMDLGVHEAQQRRHPRNMNKVRALNFVYDPIFTCLSGQTSTGTARANECHPIQLITSTPH